MEDTRLRNCKQSGFAVIRSFAPSRTENELLAHALELVGPSTASDKLEATSILHCSVPTASSVACSEMLEDQSQQLALEPIV